MDYADFESHDSAAAGPAPAAVKILIAGGFGVGKTTMVAAVSEVAPLRTEEYLTQASVGVDDTGGVEQKATTTVALDFGRITVSSELVVYLFGTPGQERFWFMWNDLVHGALGAVVLADPGGWTAVSRPSTSSRAAASPSWSASTASTATRTVLFPRSATRSTWTPTCPS